MEDMENDSEWDTEEFQAALKTVLKYEIQSLLERLSHTGEETVLLTVNTVDMCVSHLASSNAEKFVNSVDVRQIKSKFLQFITGQPSNTVGIHKPLIQSDLDCGAYSDSEIHSQEKWGPTPTTPTAAVKRAHGSDSPSQHETQNSAVKRRKVEDTTPQIQPQMRKNVSVTSAGVTPGTMKLSDQPAKVVPRAPQFDADNTREKMLQAAAGNKGKMNIKLNTTKIVSKSGGFTEERLSDMQFQNLLKLYNPDNEEEDEDECYDEEDDDEEEEEEEENLQQHMPYGHQGQHALTRPNTNRPAFQGIPIKPVNPSSTAVNARSNAPVPDIKGGRHDVKSVPDNKPTNKGPVVKKAVAGADFTKEDGGAVRNVTNQNVSSVKDNDTSKIKINPILNMTEIKEEPDPDDTAYRQNDPSPAATSAGQDKQQVGGRRPPDKPPAQQKDVRTESTQSANVKDGKPNTQPVGPQRQQRPTDDDLDTETLILMAKAKHKETESDADKAIQAKLGQLSSKLSWVVEYPKDNKEQWKGQMKQPMGKAFPIQPGLDEEEEEDYDEEEEEDFEDELDEEELAALKAFQANKLKQLHEGRFRGDGVVVGDLGGNMGVMHGLEYPPGEYGEEEMEGEYGEEYGYNPEGEEDGGMGMMAANYPHMQQGVYPGVDGGPNMSHSQQQYHQGPPSPSDNFLLTGFMAKCLICNKIIRKTEIQQHNQTHLDEEAEEDEDYDEEGVGEEDWVEGGHDLSAGEGHLLEDDQSHGLEEIEGEYKEDEDGRDGQEHYDEGMEEMTEFTAEKFVAEKVDLGTTQKPAAEAAKPSTVCDICNKQFKSVGNMQRHRKIHTDSKVYPCPKCEKTFKQSSYLLSHIRKKHPDFDPRNVSPGNGNDKSFQCDMCGESFLEEKGLLEHMKSSHKADW